MTPGCIPPLHADPGASLYPINGEDIVRKRQASGPVLGALATALLLIAAGCSNGPQPTATPQATATRPPPTPSLVPTSSPTPAPTVVRVEPVVTDLNVQDIRVRNCEQEDDLHDTLAAHVVVQVDTTVMEAAAASGGSETIAVPPELRAHLERLVALAYQDAYSEAIRALMQTEVVVPAEMMTTLRLREARQRYSGSVAFTMNDKAYTAAYEHVLSVPYLTSLEDGKCET